MGRTRKGIEARGSGIQITFHYEGERCRETLSIPATEKNLQFAELKRQQILFEIEFGSFDYAKHFPDSPRAKATRRINTRTVSQGVDLWLNTRVLTDTTRNRYRRTISAHIDLEGGIGPRAMRSILPSELLLLRAKLSEKLRPKTVNNILIPIRGCFELAHVDGVIDSNPAACLVNVLNPRDTEADPFDTTELSQLMSAFAEPERNMVELWWTTGMRGPELFGLEWQDIDWTKRTVHVRRARVENKLVATKSKHNRRVKLSDRAMEALKRQRAHTELAGGTIFLNPETGVPYTHAVVWYRKWQRACKRVKVRFRPPKQLRHTYASMALSAGEPPLFVMHQLGHSSLAMLEKHYSQWMPSANLTAGSGFDRASAAVR